MPAYVRQRVRQILKEERVEQLLPVSPRRRFRIEGVVPGGLTLQEWERGTGLAEPTRVIATKLGTCTETDGT